MERRITKKIESYQVNFKDAIKEWIAKENVSINDSGHNNKTSEFLQFIYDFQGIGISKEDFQKRKRIKNVVPHFQRCIAKKAEGQQCTRRKKDSDDFCGTHIKGTPHGILVQDGEETLVKTKIEVWVQEIKGIHYYIDTNNNVYQTEDIISNKSNPDIIAKWVLNDNSDYSIEEFYI
jgi:hypothetical protein